MKILKKILIVVIVLGVCALIGYSAFKKEIGSLAHPSDADVPATQIGESVAGFTVPDGYRMSVFADKVPGARVMMFDPRGRMLVSESKENQVVLLDDTDTNGSAESVTVVAKDLNNPHGLAMKCSAVSNPSCLLYIAEADQLTRFAYNPDTGIASNPEKLLAFPYNAADRHKTRTLQFLGDGSENTLLISIGSTCNVCVEKSPQHGSIIAYDILSKSYTPYATGLRNSVFLALHPVDGSVWATDMGRDGLGDTTPPEEVNVITKGGNYGWPLCYGNGVHDTEFDKKQYFVDPCANTVRPRVMLPAHIAPLGLAFIPEEGWSEDYWYNLLVAEHGSWNSSTPVGYKIVRIKLDESGKYLGTEDFITGWLTKDGTKLGRPAGIIAQPGGTIYVSDDDKGVIYKVSKI